MANAKHIRMIEQELEKACEKHPKFCDVFTTNMYWKHKEANLKRLNRMPPYTASHILEEEVAEAMVAHERGDREQCLQELAQCGAVILRMMTWVEEERWVKGDTCKKREVGE